MPASKILIMDDDVTVIELIKLYLEKEGYKTLEASDGKDGILKYRREKPDLIVLDLMLPEIDGKQVCREIRKTDDTPIIMLTSKEDVLDKIVGLELGADDYMVKPFDPRELVARIKAVLRRTSVAAASNDKIIKHGNLEINMTNYELRMSGKLIDIPPKELELFHYLASNPNRVFTREQLLDQVWGFDYFGDSRTVDVHIKRLRQKTEPFQENWQIKTVWGVGYKFEMTDIPAEI